MGNYNFVTRSWMDTASEDEMRDVCGQMESELDAVDWDDGDSGLYNLHNDLVNAIASRFPLNLPHREHGWYLSKDD